MIAVAPLAPVHAPPARPTYLHPGRLLVGGDGQLFSTVLGSCVAVCLWEPRAALGGMNHYVLPYPVAGAEASARFGRIAIPALVERLVALGARRSRLLAKVFGGTSAQGQPGEVGPRNAALAFELLEEARVPVLASDVGGSRGRHLLFSAGDGAAWVKLLGGVDAEGRR